MQMFILFVTLLIVKTHASGANLYCDLIENVERFDCYPEDGSSQQGCEARGCCWSPPRRSISNRLTDVLDVPYCFYPKDFPTYQVITSGLSNQGLVYALQKSNSTYRPNEILKLQATVSFDTKQRLRVKIVDPNNERYEVPLMNDNFNDKSRKLVNRSMQDDPDDTDYQVYIGQNPFFIRIFRKSTGKRIFDTSVAPLIYADQYIQFSTKLVSNYFYGIGEHRDNLAHKTSWSSFTLWNRDTSPSTNTNLYGAHPFYITIEPDGNALGFFLVNSNGMDVDVSPLPALTFTTIGGIIDFYIYLGPTPQDVVMQHTDVVGRSMFPPYFSLGFHLCRWRYDNSTNLKNVIYRNRAAGIPYDTQWTDIDAMNLRMDWTYDKENFAELPQIVDDLHAHGQHYVNIIDPAISNTAGYYPYENGVENNVFIRHSDNNEFLVGKVWPGSTVFPDFTNPNTTKWWTDLAMKFHDQVKYDGIWIDMNEPSNFVDGSDRGCTNSKYDKPPYTPRVMDRDLDSKTICPSSIQFLSNHYNLHNMYGHFEAIATFNALRTIESTKRPFVLTRSSFAGTGRYSAHWSGDNRALWDDLYYSIPNMLNFNMFGVSMVGSDICGFMGDTTEELCIRWMQLGSFYPFMRNHNDDRSKDQDPAAFSLEAQAIMKKALKMRYTLLPYLYTLFYRSVVYGETVVRPLFFEFTHDKLTHGIDQQFMFGPAFLITPVLEQGATSVQGYFPNETWYQYQNGEQLNNTQGPYVTLNAPLSEINVHVRAGYVIPYQHPSVTTTASRKNPFGLLVTLKPGLSSNGTLFWDDGESYDSIDNKKFNLFNFTANEGFLQVDRVVFGYDVQMILNEVKVYGVEKQPQAVQINNQEYDNFIYDDIHKTLNIQYFYIDLREFDSISITWN